MLAELVSSKSVGGGITVFCFKTKRFSRYNRQFETNDRDGYQISPADKTMWPSDANDWTISVTIFEEDGIEQVIKTRTEGVPEHGDDLILRIGNTELSVMR